MIRCNNCAYYQPLHIDNGVCRRNPPQVIGKDKNNGGISSSFPGVAANSTCGEVRFWLMQYIFQTAMVIGSATVAGLIFRHFEYLKGLL